MSDIAFFCYWGRPNDDVFETCMNTLLKCSPNVHLQVHSDDRPRDLSKDYGISWANVPKEKVKGRRALCKIERLQKLVRQLRQGDRLMVADVDLYFLDDPFKAFEQDFDFAVTTRCHAYRWPVNGGVFFLKINERTRRFIDFHLKQCRKPTWPPLLTFRKLRHNGVEPKYNPDWEIGQDFLCAAWLSKDKHDIAVDKDLTIVDVGPEYNYCPNTNVYGVQTARALIKDAYETKKVKVLHLKSELKLCIYDGYMEDAITKR
ncbi:MAG: putative nucleotide-diphospho-sugar transferase, partial [Planctomycetota bacterium]